MARFFRRHAHGFSHGTLPPQQVPEEILIENMRVLIQARPGGCHTGHCATTRLQYRCIGQAQGPREGRIAHSAGKSAKDGQLLAITQRCNIRRTQEVLPPQLYRTAVPAVVDYSGPRI